MSREKSEIPENKFRLCRAEWIVDPLSKLAVPPKVHVATLEELLLSEW